MKSQKALSWIKEGYLMASRHGIQSLSIESIARKINKNKSSFYHYFGDLDNFTNELLTYHIQQAQEAASLASQCEHMKPDVLNLFVDRKTDIFFHKQLRLNREDPACKKCYEEAFNKLETAMLDKWAVAIGLQNQQLFAQTFLNLIVENFLLRITEQTFDYQWLENYLGEVKTIIRQFHSNPNIIYQKGGDHPRKSLN